MENRNILLEDTIRRSKTEPKTVVFVWENFGPTHDDRCQAVAAMNAYTKVIGLQFYAKSEIYDWQPQPDTGFSKITLFEGIHHTDRNFWVCAATLIKSCRRAKATDVFFCHYEWPEVAIAAIVLRLLGKHVFLLYDSKFDDYPRFIWRELFKSLWLLPYQGALVASKRSKDYLRFLGMRSEPIEFGYDTISLARIRRLAGTAAAPEGCLFQSRHFTIIARLVDKKNLHMALKAYANYALSTSEPRPLRLFGAGPLEAALREEVRLANLQHLVTFEGFQQTEAIAAALGSSLAVLLVSQEEQFGFAIIEALAMGVPVLISPACGAHDEFVRSGVNGFVVEPDNIIGLAHFMSQLAGDELLWKKMVLAALAAAEQADAALFAAGVARLIRFKT
jgi:glycosyltransferase involved in cell wall biosynthesis